MDSFSACARYVQGIFFSSEDPLPAGHEIVSVRCIGNGSASVSYDLSDTEYECGPGGQVQIQVDYVCYSKDSHSSCIVSRVSS